MGEFIISGNYIDIISRRIYKAELTISEGKIRQIKEVENVDNVYLLPGFIDAHVHIESSMLVPSEFAKLAVVHGTVAAVSDPHEIANVLGREGVEFMIENGKTVPFHFYFGAPSCVPATQFETAGAEVTAHDIEILFQNPEIKYLAEMMNWPGVIYNDPIVYEKINLAKKYNKVIDGHAPGLRDSLAVQYINAGMSTDHECFTIGEAMDKLQAGMKILIREGSAAKNFEELIPLLHDYEDSIMFCSDDKHPDSLILGHINDLVKRALEKGIDLFKVLKAACLNPIFHYGLETGMLRENESADFIVVDNLNDFTILKTFIQGKLVAENGKSLIETFPCKILNKFHATIKHATDFLAPATKKEIKIIEVIDGQLITHAIYETLLNIGGYLQTDIDKDILKITVVNRYNDAPPSVAFIKGFGLKSGALASSVAHDSHNIVAVGTCDSDLENVVNEVIKNKGGIAAVFNDTIYSLPLPIAGLMSAYDGYSVADKYIELDTISKEMGSMLLSPFMSLSFMALLVIPSLKLSDLGLFDGDKFEFVQ